MFLQRIVGMIAIMSPGQDRQRMSLGVGPLGDEPNRRRCYRLEQGAICVREHVDSSEPGALRDCGQLVGSIQSLVSLVLTIPA
jgi:hypothetical protein